MNSDELNRAFAALADPTRRAILSRLASGEATVTELAEPFEMTQPSISKHLKVLELAGLISRGRAAQTRPCRLETSRLKDIAQWVNAYRALWEQSFDRLRRFCSQPNHCQRKERKMLSNDDKAAFVITRQFELPRAVVWKAWSVADQLKHWWGPQGCSIDIHRFEFRAGFFITQ
jgi:DNA-binding transcriptional ArsR family regulator